MIKISENGKSLVDVEDWSDILERPGFMQRLDHNKIKLKQIIGQYSIHPKQPCGLKSCGTNHNRGYLVLAEGGVETNIGNVCGKRIFGVEFKTLQKSFRKSVNAQRYRLKIEAVQSRVAAIKRDVSRLWNGEQGGEWCYQQLHSYMTRLFPESISRPLTDRSKRKNGIVEKGVRLTQDEIEAGMGRGQSQFRTETVFLISGIAAPTSYKRLRTILRQYLGSELNSFAEVDPATANFESLRRWNNWTNKLESRLKEAEDIIHLCKRFLDQNNIQNIRINAHLL